MTFHLEPRDRNLLLAVAVLLVVFAAGAVGGAALVSATRGGAGPFERRIERFGPRMEEIEIAGGPGERHEVVFMRGPGMFDNRLDLSQSQRARIDSLMEEQSRKAEQLMRDMEPRLRALTDSTDAAIEALLTPEQREEFRQLRAEGRDKIRRRFVRPAPVPAPPAPAPPPE